MKAIRIHKFGPTAEVLQYEEVPIPEPGPNELLIKVEAASLNRADLALTKGTYRIAPEELPVIPGREFAGTVAKLGAGVQEFKVGQRVVAYTGTEATPSTRSPRSQRLCQFPTALTRQLRQRCPQYFSPPGSVC